MGIRSKFWILWHYSNVSTHYIIKEAKLFIDIMEGMALIQGKFPSL